LSDKIILAIVAIVAVCATSFTAMVGLLLYFSDKRIKAGWTTKAEVKDVKAMTGVNIEADPEKKDRIE
jgi:hypothetical protein